MYKKPRWQSSFALDCRWQRILSVGNNEATMLDEIDLGRLAFFWAPVLLQ
jgi:hypothetical protein